MTDKPKPSYAPLYCAIYEDLAASFRAKGYALAIHGSLRRDFDLIAVPWVEKPTPPQKVVDSITEEFSLKQIGEPTEKLHGRMAWTISLGWGHCALDLSFVGLPRLNN